MKLQESLNVELVSANSLTKATFIYNTFTSILLGGKRARSALDYINLAQIIAHFAWKIHCGRFTDTVIENHLLELGRRLEHVIDPNSRDFQACLSNLKIPTKELDRKSILHIVTTAYSTGGHSRLIKNIIELDMASTHHLVVTNQEDTPFPDSLQVAIEASGGEVFHLSHENVMMDALLTRVISQDVADVVFLHIHPDDVLPVIAFAVDAGPPVALVNHADHAYWLGTSITDLIVNIRDSAGDLSYRRREAKKCMTLPIPLREGSSTVSKQDARDQLNIPKENPVALTMGASYKFVPNSKSNFFKTMVKVLDEIPELHLKVIGISEDDDLDKIGFIRHERIQLLGVIEQPEIYQVAADIVIDPLPYGSYIALLESVILGSYPCMIKNTTALFELSQDPGLQGLIVPAENESKFISMMVQLCADKRVLEEKAEEVRRNLLKHHSGDAVFDALKEIYTYMNSIQHQPAPAGEAVCMDSEEDITFSELGNNQFSAECDKLLFGITKNSGSFTHQDITALIPVINTLTHPRKGLAAKIILKLYKNNLL